MKQKGLKFVTKIALLTGLIAAIASLLVGMLIFDGSTKIIFKNAIDGLRHETKMKALFLTHNIAALTQDIKHLVSTPPLKGIPRAIKGGGIDPSDNSSLADWEYRLGTIFTELIRVKPYYMQVRLIGINDGGKEMIRADRNGTSVRMMPEDGLQKKGNTEYFKNAIKAKSGEVYLSNITLNREHGKVVEPNMPVLRAATPVYFEDKLFGIIVINMDLSNLINKMIKSTPRFLTPFVTNEQGYYLAHPDISKTFGFDLGHDSRITDVYPSMDLMRHVDLRDDDITITTDQSVINVVKARFDPLDKGRFVAVMLATSVDNLLSESIGFRNKSFIIIILLVLASLIISAILAYRLMKPLRLISQASADFAAGKPVRNLPLQAAGEIGELARAFDDMRIQLEEKEKQLLKTQARAHYVNKMASLGEMAGSMAHEINSPLQVITLIANRVRRRLLKGDSDGIEVAMESIDGAVLKITNTIDSLRKMSRNSENDEFEFISVGDIIADLTGLIGERYRLKDINFEVIYNRADANTELSCQRLQVGQIIMNLLNNSYDAVLDLETKWIKLEITLVEKIIEISVTDSGRGIPVDIQDRVFEPLFTSKDIGAGTGIGLSIAAKIAKNHHGVLELDTSAKNTRFVLSLPVDQEVCSIDSSNVIALTGN